MGSCWGKDIEHEPKLGLAKKILANLFNYLLKNV
jgi:hypothetical protein